MKGSILLFALFACFATYTSVWAASGDAFCAQLHARKYYKPAAECYQKEADALPFLEHKDERRRLLKGSHYREAARNLHLAAAQEARIEIAAYIREQAVSLLQKVLQLGLVRRTFGKRRGRLIRVMMEDIRTQIGYATLSISTSHNKAQIRIVGYQTDLTAFDKFSQSLRPGPYTITIKYPDESIPRERKISLKPKTPAVFAFIQAPPLPALAWIGYTVGAVALLAGGALLAYGAYFILDGTNCSNSPNCAFRSMPNPADGYTTCWKGDTRAACQKTGQPAANKSEPLAQYQGIGTPWLVIGGISAAVGATLLSIAIIAHVRSRSIDFQQKLHTAFLPALSPLQTSLPKLDQKSVLLLKNANIP